MLAIAAVTVRKKSGGIATHSKGGNFKTENSSEKLSLIQSLRKYSSTVSVIHIYNIYMYM